MYVAHFHFIPSNVVYTLNTFYFLTSKPFLCVAFSARLALYVVCSFSLSPTPPFLLTCLHNVLAFTHEQFQLAKLTLKFFIMYHPPDDFEYPPTC